jgi:hypothetical protein
MPSRWRSRIKERSNSAKAPITERISFATALLAGGGERLGAEVDRDSLPGQLRDDRAQVVEVPGEAVHRVHDHGAALGHDVHQRLELGPGHVSPRGPLDEGAIDGHPLELASSALVEGAHPDVADALPAHRLPLADVSGWTLRPCGGCVPRCRIGPHPDGVRGSRLTSGWGIPHPDDRSKIAR